MLPDDFIKIRMHLAVRPRLMVMIEVTMSASASSRLFHLSPSRHRRREIVVFVAVWASQIACRMGMMCTGWGCFVDKRALPILFSSRAPASAGNVATCAARFAVAELPLFLHMKKKQNPPSENYMTRLKRAALSLINNL